MGRKTRANTEEDINEADLSEEGRLIVLLLEQKIEKIVSKFTSEVKDRDAKIDHLKTEVDLLKQKVNKMEEKLDEADAYERRDTVIFSGQDLPTATDGERSYDVVCSLVKEKLKLNICSTDISTAHRIGPKPRTQGPDKRNIIVKLCRRELKYDLISASKRIKPTNIYINENLTPTRNNILFVLRLARRKYPNIVSGCSSHDGKVYAWVKPPNPEAAGARDTKMFINTQEKLNLFCQKNFNIDAEELISKN